MKLYAATLVDETKPKRPRKKAKKEAVNEAVEEPEKDTPSIEPKPEVVKPEVEKPEVEKQDLNYTKLYQDITRLEEAINTKSELPKIDYDALAKAFDKFTEYEQQLELKLKQLKEVPKAPKKSKRKRIVYDPSTSEESEEEVLVKRKSTRTKIPFTQNQNEDVLFKTIFGDRA